MNDILNNLIDRYPPLSVCEADIREMTEILTVCYRSGGKLLLCGNGGSAADCEHIVGELLKSFRKPRPLSRDAKEAIRRLGGTERLADAVHGALPAIALTSHIALSTAFGNDVDGSCTFAQQVWGLGKETDVLLGISTSGNSENVRNAAIVAKVKGMKVLGLTGESGGELSALCDVCVRVPATEAYVVQEYHLPIYHAICLILEDRFF